MRIFGLIGNPIGHSFSKTYFTEKFEREGISDARYELFPLENLKTEWPKLLAEQPNLRGVNVTIPYKSAIIPMLDEVDPVAKIIGAVNAIRIENGRTIGYNTDVIGFEKSLKKWLTGLKASPTEAFILGTGGAAKAVANVLLRMGLLVWNVSRNPMQSSHLPYEMLPSMIRPRKKLLFVNTTPAGMSPNADEMPEVPCEMLTKFHLVFDLVYNPEETKLMRLAAAQGCPVKGGLEMLHLQAEEAWKIFDN